MPHGTFKKSPHPLNSGVASCPCGQTFIFTLDRDRDMKFWIHNKVCPGLVKGYEQVRVPKKAMTLKEVQHDAKKTRRVHEQEKVPIQLG